MQQFLDSRLRGNDDGWDDLDGTERGNEDVLREGRAPARPQLVTSGAIGRKPAVEVELDPPARPHVVTSGAIGGKPAVEVELDPPAGCPLDCRAHGDDEKWDGRDGKECRNENGEVWGLSDLFRIVVHPH